MKAETGWLPGNLLVLEVMGAALEPGVPTWLVEQILFSVYLEVSRSSLSFSIN